MSGSTFGQSFCVTNFGESHGPAIGCVVDGCPPGLELSESDLQPDLDRRKPGSSRHVTQRRESDRVEILSGLYQGRTTGTPIALLIRNEDAKSRDYAELARTFRPGHADYTYWRKYGVRDPRGGGRSSARLTAPMVAAGAIAKKWLALAHGTRVRGHLQQLGDIEVPFESWDEVERNAFFAASAACVERLEAAMDELRRRGDSCGAIIRIVASGVPAGLGNPLYDKLDARIAYAMMGINAVKAVEIGAGFGAAAELGSTHGDEMTPEGFASNHAGGTLGGLSSGQDIEVRIALKPTSSIRIPRRSVDLQYKPVSVSTEGRHDPCVGIRAAPIAEAMLALVLIDLALLHRAQNAQVRHDLPDLAARIED
jgi:chorismate synthase